jgi:2-dehydro-3-deoxyphosphogluconate aldolase/(4S)-4-hydroxy-2-oxoglutarate aldolase
MIEILREDRVLAVIRAKAVPRPRDLVEALLAAGIRCVEFTLTIDDGLAAIEAAAQTDAIVGAGTVLSAEQARDAASAGASFLVSPVSDEQVLEVAGACGLPFLAGALTPSEILAAHRAGAAAVKIFPARLGGPDFIRDLRAPLPHVEFLPSGGVNESNAAAFLEAGAFAVSSGTSTVPASLVENSDHSAIERRARVLVSAIRTAP